jgi:hypothetical protein
MAGLAMVVTLGFAVKFAVQAVVSMGGSQVADGRGFQAAEFQTESFDYLTRELGMEPSVAMSVIKVEVDFLSQNSRSVANESTSAAHRRTLEELFKDPSKCEKYISFRSDFIQKKR